MRAEAQLVPTCVVGAEEAAPVFGQVDVLRRLTGLHLLPDHARPSPGWGRSGMLGYLPAKFRIRFLEPIDTVGPGRCGGGRGQGAGPDPGPGDPRPDPGEPSRDAGQEAVGLARLSDASKQAGALAEPGAPADASTRRVLVTGLSTYWGGRLAQALESFEQIEAIIGVDVERSHPGARADRVREGHQPALAAGADRSGRRDRHRDRHPAGRQLADGAASTRAREQRDRDDEHPRRLHRAATRRSASSCSRAPPTTTAAEQDDPAFFTERMARPHPPRTGLERDIVEAEQTVSEFARAKPDGHGHGAALRQRARAGRRHRVHPDVPRSRWCRWCWVSTRGFSSSTRTTSSTPWSTPPSTSRPGVYNVAADGVLALSEVIGLLGKRAAADPAALGHGARRPARCGGSGSGSRTRWSTSCGSGAGSTTGCSRRPGFDYGYTTREAVLKLGEHMRLAPVMRGTEQDLHVRARGRGVPALEPERAARAPRRAGRRGRGPRAAGILSRAAAGWAGSQAALASGRDGRKRHPALPKLQCWFRGTQGADSSRRRRWGSSSSLAVARVRDRPRELGQDRRRHPGRRRARSAACPPIRPTPRCSAKLVEPLDKPVTVTFEGRSTC